MRQLFVWVTLLGFVALSKGQAFTNLLSNLRATGASRRTMNRVQKVPMEVESAKLDDMLEDLQATKRAIEITKPDRFPDLEQDFKDELIKIKRIAKRIRPAARHFRRNLESPRGIGKEMDVILKIFKTSITNVLDTMEKLMPHTAPVMSFVRVFIETVFG